MPSAEVNYSIEGMQALQQFAGQRRYRCQPRSPCCSGFARLAGVSTIETQSSRAGMLSARDGAKKECLAAVPNTSLSGKRVVREVNALIARPGRRGATVSDNGTEFTSSAVLAFAQATGLDWRCTAPGKPSRTLSPRAGRDGCETNR